MATSRSKRPIHQYTEEALSDALKAVREEKISIREACRRFGVPKTTIIDRLNGRIKEGPRKMGPDTVLTANEETELVEWLCELAKCGFPRKKVDLLDTVQAFVRIDERQTPFKDGRPGEKWYKSFLKRHKQLSFREPESLTSARSLITEQYLRKWFEDLKSFLLKHNAVDILEDPARILNGDETSFSMCPKTGKVIAPKGWKNLYEHKRGNEKETITVLLVFNAEGKTVYPMVVFPFVRPPKAVVDSIPSTWFLGKSESGWMRGDVFYEYIANGVNKWLTEENIPRPVLLLIDGHKSHLTFEISEFCNENKIILYALPPNTTHIMQPADVSVFKPLKTQWKETVRAWQSKPENVNCVLNKTNFCPLLKEVLDKTNASLPETIRNGFRKCGLFPFDPDLVDYSKCIQNRLENLNEALRKPNPNVTQEQLQITEHVLTQFQEKLSHRGIINIPEIINKIKEIASEVTSSVTETYEVTMNGELKLIKIDDNNCSEKVNFGEVLQNDIIWEFEEENNQNKIEFNDQNEMAMKEIWDDNEIQSDPIMITVGNPKENIKDKTENHTEDIEAMQKCDDDKLNNDLTLKFKEKRENYIKENETDKENENNVVHKIVSDKMRSDDLTLVYEEQQGNDDKKSETDKDNENNVMHKILSGKMCSNDLTLVSEEKQENDEKDKENETQKKIENDVTQEIESNVAANKIIGERSKTKNITILQNICLPRNASLKGHLYWPKPFEKSTKPKKDVDKPPAAISSDSFRDFLRRKDEEKQLAQAEKEKRKAIRLKRSSERRENIKNKKKKITEATTTEEIRTEGEKIGMNLLNKTKEKCSNCDSELESDTEENELKNVGCDRCSRWFHLKCTDFCGQLYADIGDLDFVCPFC